jgi:hypothetical protein
LGSSSEDFADEYARQSRQIAALLSCGVSFWRKAGTPVSDCRGSFRGVKRTLQSITSALQCKKVRRKTPARYRSLKA